MNVKSLDTDEELVSFDVSLLYTNVDTYIPGINENPLINKETFVLPAKLSSMNIVRSTTDNFYKQEDMESPPAP